MISSLPTFSFAAAVFAIIAKKPQPNPKHEDVHLCCLLSFRLALTFRFFIHFELVLVFLFKLFKTHIYICIYSFIWLHLVSAAALGIFPAPERVDFNICSAQALQLWRSGLAGWWHVGSQFPDQGLKLCPLHCKADS